MKHQVELMLAKAIVHGIHKRGYSRTTCMLMAREDKLATDGCSWLGLVLHAIRLTIALNF